MDISTPAPTTSPNAATLALLNVLIQMYRPDIIDTEHRVKSVPLTELRTHYDYIVVGGGTAGSVVANRLSENSNWTVLLLEAGHDELPLSDVPILWPDLLGRPDLIWNYTTEPSDRYCLAMNNHQCSFPRGRVLGGGSVSNAMAHVRGNKNDYDRWGSLGNKGWDYEGVLPYFRKAEDMRIKDLADSPYHSTGGYQTIDHVRFRTPIADYLLRAGVELGYNLTDYNGERQTGTSILQAAVRDGLRCSSAKAYIRSASKRPNLHVSLNSTVEKILIREEGKTKKAHAVQFRVGGTVHTVSVHHEIVLSAGPIGSPQLLMVSGIGPKKHLEELDIPVVHNAPGVGQNLQDHVSIGGLFYLIDPPKDYMGVWPFASVGDAPYTRAMVDDFIFRHEGPFYTQLLCENIMFVNTKYANKSIDWPDIEFMVSTQADNTYGGRTLAKGVNLRDDFYNDLIKNVEDKPSYAILPLLLRPKSSGYIKLRSKDQRVHPIIVPNYFSHPHDLDVIAQAAQIIRQFSKSPTMRKLNARPNPNHISACASHLFLSDDYFKCLAQQYSMTIYHLCGTCKMGPASDPMAVVDDRLRVRGVQGLRVIDASIMPYITNGNTNSPTVMIGEKGSDLIKQDRGGKHKS
ncbi:glucose dehydrogenase [FAD, quinone]-like [Nomia melanderi]|uniref:glucose dehydrogenase [FAD, quinone]-like n=1 Tax=Nomia melanderi TaxID=2448451 RepID=UPI001303FD3C|nr:glucose dehydrogenase [FAD, quinone]-like [Nomia melanderi]